MQKTNIAKDRVRVNWMGTAGLYVSERETGLYIDPFVSRYGLFKVGFRWKLDPAPALIGVDLDEFFETMADQGNAYSVKILPIGEPVALFR